MNNEIRNYEEILGTGVRAKLTEFYFTGDDKMH